MKYQELRQPIANSKTMMDAIYLSFLRACKTLGAFHLMRRVESVNLLQRYHAKGRLEPQGAFKGIMFIGQNPSVRSKLKNVWNDPYGKYFGEFLDQAGINKAEVWMTNLYKKPTEDNRSLTEKEISEGMEELLLEIRMVDPTVIVTLGTQVSEAVNKAVNAVNIWHPSFVNRFPGNKGRYVEELRSIKEKYDQKRIYRRSSKERIN